MICQHFTCPMCGSVYFLRSRFEAHREEEIPAFIKWNEGKRAASEQRFRDYQQSIGWMDSVGRYVKGLQVY